MLKEILPEKAVETLEKERQLLERVRDFAQRFEAEGAAARRVGELVAHLDEMFLLVVVGEVKAGKSAFINALLGEEKVCPEGPLPLTDKIHVLCYGEVRDRRVAEEHVVRHDLPLDELRHMNVVDTPGTNSPLEQHQQITEAFLPRADIVFFVTSIDCPLTQTEIELLGSIRRRWRKEVACVLAKVDTRGQEDIDTVVKYLRESFESRLGFSPPIFTVSSHAGTGIEEVRDFVVGNLTEAQRILLKLKSPLGTVLDIIDGIESESQARRELLESDFKGWNAIQEQVSFAATSLKERAERHVSPILASFENLESRGRDFLRDKIRITNLKLVTDRGRFNAAFEHDVARGVAKEIEGRVEEAVQWLGEETHGLWERTLSHFNETVSLSRYRDEIAAGAGPKFRATRQETLDGIVSAARRNMESWNVDAECGRIRELASKSLARVVGTEVVAAGIGAVLAAVVAPLAGIAVGAALAVGGFFILPARRQKAVERFEEGVRRARDAVLAAVREAIATEADRAAAAVLDAFTPFSDFYEGRRRALEGVRGDAKGLREEVAVLMASLEHDA
ncbi:MAG: dynamin family protein [Planctomycetota bacterium]|jgi:GTP-binding protein EngB required for normal cell division